MKTKRIQGVIAILLMLLTTGGAAAAAAQTVIHVAPSGSDSNAGTKNSPLGSIAAARDAVRPLLPDMEQNIEVHLAPGTYVLEQALEFTNEDSGRNGHTVIYRSAGGPGKAQLKGGRTLTGWQKVDEKVWQISLPDVESCHTLYEGGKRVRKARYPNYVLEEDFPTAAGPYLSTITGSNKDQATRTESWIIIDTNDLANIPTDFGTMKINIFPWGKCDWQRWISSVTKVDKKDSRITLNNDGDNTPMIPSYGGKTGARAKARYFLEEHRDFLDAPGEFYFDAATKVLYVIPYAEGHPDTLGVVLPVLRDIIRFEGSSYEDAVHDIQLEGLSLEYSKAISPTRFWWAQAWGYTDHALIWMNNARNISVIGCHLKNSGRNGVMMVGQNTRNLIYGCWIEQMGVNGVTLSNWSVHVMEKSGDAARIKQNVISNNRIQDVGQLSIYCAGINIYSASHNRISHNEIFRSPRYAITMRGNAADKSFTSQTPTPTAKNPPPSAGNLFEYLKIYDCSQDSGDCGAIHAALVNNKNGPFINTFRQITIDNTRAAPHVTDIRPNGIFLDWPGRTMHQRFVDMEIKNSDSKAFRSNGADNEVSAQTENVSWKEPFEPDHMQYSKIGLKPDFPAAYGGKGEPIQRPALPSDDRTGFERYRFDNSYADVTGFSTMNPAGAPVFSTNVKRDGAAALRFDGQDDLLTALTASIDEDFTVSLWARHEAQTDGHSLWRPLVYSGHDFDKGAIVIAAKRSDAGEPGTLTFGVDSYETFNVGFDDGNWHFVTLTKSGQTWRAYHNGSPLGGGPISTYSPDGMSLQVGGDGDKASLKRNFRGYVDDVRIWNYALDDAEVAKIYAAYPEAEPEDDVHMTLHEVAVKAVRPASAPKYSDVCFRYGWIRESLPEIFRKDTARGVEFPKIEDAKAAIQGFHATRVDWFYPGWHTANPDVEHVTGMSKDFIDWCHARGMKVIGAMNSNTSTEEVGYNQAHFGRYVGDVDKPEYVAAAIAWGKQQIDAGVDGLLCDDFFKYDARRKQIFSDQVISAIKALKPGFEIAGNHGGFIGTEYVQKYAFDYHYSDSSFIPTPGAWWKASKDHRALSSAFLIHPNKNMSKATRRSLIGLGYGSGAHVIAPWDEYVHGNLSGGTAPPRLFADPKDYADLYAFARALGQAGYLDGYEDAAVGGYDLTETRYGPTPPVSVTGGSGKLSVFARAKPGEADAPVILHLVDNGNPTPFQLRLLPSAFFKSGDFSVSLLVPPAYNAALHEKAASSGDYSTLSHETALETIKDGKWVVVDVPAVNPWGVVIVRPQN